MADRPAVSWPHVDVTETEDDFRVSTELPGMDAKDVKVTLYDGVLRLKCEKKSESDSARYSERWHGQFERSLQLGPDIDPDKVNAAFRNGVLTITVPKRPEAQRHVKRDQQLSLRLTREAVTALLEAPRSSCPPGRFQQFGGTDRLHRCLPRAAGRRDAVEVAGAFFEGADHAAHRFAEQHLDHPLHQPGLEFEIDIKIDAAPPLHPLEHPMVVEPAERSLGVGHVDTPGRVERDARRKALAEHAEADDHVGDHEVGSAFLDAGRKTPGQKLGIALDIGDEREKLLRRVG